MSKYFLKSEDLDEVYNVKVSNPYGNKYGKMTLYLEQDILRHKKIDERKHTKNKKDERKQDLITQRRKRLEQGLNKNGLILRDDSKLCHAYISGKKTIQNNRGDVIHLTMKFIIHEMSIMKYLYEYTDFQTRVQKEINRIADDYGYYPMGIYKMANDVVKNNMMIPKTFPWNNNL